HKTREELARLVDPANYLGQCGEMVDRVLAKQKSLQKA
ncbi:MAG: Adenylosuccinate lyase C-terminus, partial [Hyphomicrobiales bacterium]|nr:Adenylosuccinate lyase C-terminus [Hyphomicrobiales bacterium]